MNDTPQHIKALQLKIWLSKSPADRLKQFMEDNSSMFKFWKGARISEGKKLSYEEERKVIDFIMDFESGKGRLPGLCRVRVWDLSSGSKVAIITEIGGDLNPGSSVTNSIKAIYLKLIAENLINSSTYIIEHYEPGPVNGHTFDYVTFDRDMLPVWECTEAANICDKLKISKEALTSLVEDDKKLMKEVVSKTQLMLHQKEALRKPQQVESIVYKEEIKKLIEKNTSERELQIVLKKNMSLLAEVYADPKDEYICFSEFPIANRKADFVVFTGRSKMSVIIIEIKGADFFFSNKGSYKKMNEKISTCRHQVIESINEVCGSYYEIFRAFCHKVRLDIENGDVLYNSLTGPKKCLQVDEAKEIKIFGVVIGGRTRDDLYESGIRHHEENLTHKVRIESWDSWLNKLTHS